MIFRHLALFLLLALAPLVSLAQATTAFTYQGRLYNAGTLANGSYSLRIRPYDNSGIPITAAITTPVNVVDGIFSTTLDFGANVFLGGPVFLEIEVQAPAGSFITLTPRQPVLPAPYAINADKVDGLDAAQIGNHDYADFFALVPPNNVASVAPGTDVAFPQDGPVTAGGVITRISPSNFLVYAIGTYQVSFQVPVDQAGQLVLTLNGADLAYTVVGRAIGSSQISGVFLIETTSVNSILTVRNPAGNPTALTITPFAGGTRPTSAHLVITQLR